MSQHEEMMNEINRLEREVNVILEVQNERIQKAEKASAQALETATEARALCRRAIEGANAVVSNKRFEKAVLGAVGACTLVLTGMVVYDRFGR